MTLFAKKVYKVVLKIPFGKMYTYEWVAKKAGRPKAIRAVGNILKRNPLPFIIPCHRVIRKDGSVGGYFLGKRFKKELLNLERIIFKLLKEKDDGRNKDTLKGNGRKMCF